MGLLSFYAFLFLGGYLLLSALRFGIPNMVSDTYYQLKNSSNSKSWNIGWLFTLIMLVVAFLMMICLLDSGKGIQCLAFIGCVGLAFVGVAPNYLDKEKSKIHKGGAIIAAVGCVGWCLSVCWWVTLIVGTVYLLYLLYMDVARRANGMLHISNVTHKFHPWYWLEIAGFVDVFSTYWVCV